MAWEEELKIKMLKINFVHSNHSLPTTLDQKGIELNKKKNRISGKLNLRKRSIKIIKNRMNRKENRKISLIRIGRMKMTRIRIRIEMMNMKT